MHGRRRNPLSHCANKALRHYDPLGPAGCAKRLKYLCVCAARRDLDVDDARLHSLLPGHIATNRGDAAA
eukprot:2433102-Lingulodinium_polyedra.AAC.1